MQVVFWDIFVVVVVVVVVHFPYGLDLSSLDVRASTCYARVKMIQGQST